MYPPITITIFPDPEKWLRENMPIMNWDSVAAVVPNSPYQGQDMTCEFVDLEEDEVKVLCMEDYHKGLRLLCEQIGHTNPQTGKGLYVGMIESPFDLTDFGNWDVEVVDAFFQLCFYGEVIYG